MEEQPRLQRSERPDVFQPRISGFERLDDRLIDCHQLDVRRGQTTRVGSCRMRCQRTQSGRPQLRQFFDVGAFEHARRELESRPQRGPVIAVDHHRVDVQRETHRNIVPA